MSISRDDLESAPRNSQSTGFDVQGLIGILFSVTKTDPLRIVRASKTDFCRLIKELAKGRDILLELGPSKYIWEERKNDFYHNIPFDHGVPSKKVFAFWVTNTEPA